VLRVAKPKEDIMNTFKALAWIASGHIRARNERRTASMINDLPASVQKDIGWKWTSAKQSQRTALDWDLM
jgi:hypothetical protein